MTIHVTQDDIEHSFELECLNCPVALALFRETGRRWEVSPIPGSTCRYFAMDQGDGDGTKYLLPGKVSAFILTFDSFELVEPFVFEFLWKGAKS